MRLGVAFVLLALLGIALSLWVMQLVFTGAVGHEQNRAVRQVRAFALGLLAFSLCWSLAYADDMRWQPWPPTVLIITAIDVFLIATVVGAFGRGRALG